MPDLYHVESPEDVNLLITLYPLEVDMKRLCNSIEGPSKKSLQFNYPRCLSPIRWKANWSILKCPHKQISAQG